MMPERLAVLLIEDNESDADLLVRLLKKSGAQIFHERVENALQMHKALDEYTWDVVISDYSLPDFSAGAALELLQKRDIDVPFIIVSGTMGEETAVDMMRAGAHDYLMKNNLPRLLPAIERELAQAETRRRRRQDIIELELANHQLRNLQNSLPQALFSLDIVNGKMLQVSPAHELVFGRQVEEFFANPNLWYEMMLPEDKPVVDAGNQKLAEGKRIQHQFRIRRPDGQLRWIEAVVNPTLGADGILIRVDGVASDVTERNRLQEQLLHAQKMDAFGQLAGGIAHDFNNLLTVIMGNNELLSAETPAEDPKKVFILDIRDATQQAAALTRQLLAFSRKQVIEPKVLNLNELLTGIESMLKRLIGEDIALASFLDSHVANVKVDANQIHQVVVNLAVNARDAMRQGGRLTFTTANVEWGNEDRTADEDWQPGQYVRLSVADTGTGMTPEVKERIFEPFFTTKESGRGTGLGLATVFGIVKQSGAFIRVDSEVGKGSCFNIYFPAVAAEAEKAPAQPQEAAALGNETVLVVEDETGVRRIIREILSRRGYQVLEAENGVKALGVLEAHQSTVDLMVTDTVMPEMGGSELAKTARSRWPALRILFMSGYTDDAVLRHGISHAEEAFLHKPFSSAEFARKVREVLDARPAV